MAGADAGQLRSPWEAAAGWQGLRARRRDADGMKVGCRWFQLELVLCSAEPLRTRLDAVGAVWLLLLQHLLDNLLSWLL